MRNILTVLFFEKFTYIYKRYSEILSTRDVETQKNLKPTTQKFSATRKLEIWQNGNTNTIKCEYLYITKTEKRIPETSNTRVFGFSNFR